MIDVYAVRITFRAIEIRQQPACRGVFGRLGVAGSYPGDLFKFVWRRSRLPCVEYPDDRADQIPEQRGLVKGQRRPEAGSVVGLDPLPFLHGEVRFPSVES